MDAAPASIDELLKLIAIDGLAAETEGSPNVIVAIVDGPARRDHPALRGAAIQPIGSALDNTCRSAGPACDHGTFITGLLASRSATAPGICPACTFFLRPVFADDTTRAGGPNTTAEELAIAIADCVRAGAAIVNLSLSVRRASARGQAELRAAIDGAAARGVLIIAAAGNEAAIAGSTLTRHPWVLPVVAYDRRGALASYSNLGRSIGRGVGAPGDRMIGLGVEGERPSLGGTSAATAFVSGAAALLWSIAPTAPAGTLRGALSPSSSLLVPPLLNGRSARERLSTQTNKGANLWIDTRKNS